MKKKKIILCFMKMKNKANKLEETSKKEDNTDNKSKKKVKKAETEYENTAADDYLDWLSDQW